MENRKVHSDENLLLGKGNCYCNGKRGEWWHNRFDPLKYKHYKGSLLKINFLGKVYWKVLCNAKLGHRKLGIPLTSYCAFF